jgi:hypothetical protein
MFCIPGDRSISSKGDCGEIPSVNPRRIYNMRGAAIPPTLTALQPLATLTRTGLSQSRQALNSVIQGSGARHASSIEHSSVLPPQLIEPGVILRGYSGKEYTIQNVLQDRQNRQVYLAR